MLPLRSPSATRWAVLQNQGRLKPHLADRSPSPAPSKGVGVHFNSDLSAVDQWSPSSFIGRTHQGSVCVSARSISSGSAHRSASSVGIRLPINSKLARAMSSLSRTSTVLAPPSLARFSLGHFSENACLNLLARRSSNSMGQIILEPRSPDFLPNDNASGQRNRTSLHTTPGVFPGCNRRTGTDCGAN